MEKIEFGSILWVLIVAIIYNIVTYSLFYLDKKFSRRQRRRIPEGVLLGTSFLFGAPGSYLGMVVNRHKTLHPQFFLGIPAMQCLQFVAVIIIAVLIAQKTGNIIMELLLIAALWLISFIAAVWKGQHRSKPKRPTRKNRKRI